ncbi:uncharacterized protein B0H64DRAFT_408519 [Chaetomium fimeti]|uniref:Uncharacterized protein n=1 Tax=Chaetomium fimeti TaxID=1854472 RepID=A0AAE0H8U2_9PEZI|nr:hypothetical protein B0H64DRAFT_408519 [Chaetomium fimeti]
MYVHSEADSELQTPLSLLLTPHTPRANEEAEHPSSTPGCQHCGSTPIPSPAPLKWLPNMATTTPIALVEPNIDLAKAIQQYLLPDLEVTNICPDADAVGAELGDPSDERRAPRSIFICPSTDGGYDLGIQSIITGMFPQVPAVLVDLEEPTPDAGLVAGCIRRQLDALIGDGVIARG